MLKIYYSQHLEAAVVSWGLCWQAKQVKHWFISDLSVIFWWYLCRCLDLLLFISEIQHLGKLHVAVRKMTPWIWLLVHFVWGFLSFSFFFGHISWNARLLSVPNACAFCSISAPVSDLQSKAELNLFEMQLWTFLLAGFRGSNATSE